MSSKLVVKFLEIEGNQSVQVTTRGGSVLPPKEVYNSQIEEFIATSYKSESIQVINQLDYDLEVTLYQVVEDEMSEEIDILKQTVIILSEQTVNMREIYEQSIESEQCVFTGTEKQVTKWKAKNSYLTFIA